MHGINRTHIWIHPHTPNVHTYTHICIHPHTPNVHTCTHICIHPHTPNEHAYTHICTLIFSYRHESKEHTHSHIKLKAPSTIPLKTPFVTLMHLKHQFNHFARESPKYNSYNVFIHIHCGYT